MTREPAFAPITELSAALYRGELSPAGLVDLYAGRIDRLAATSKAFICTDFERAREAALALGDPPDTRQPLWGIPYACKDLFDVAGLITTGGSRVLHDNLAQSDAVSVARMKAAGALMIGKNNLHEFAYGATGENSLFGTPPNPYAVQRLCGGSSSGSAAALAYGLCAAALGTDTGGSVRAPAALCGLVGFKPTFGRISTEGVIPYSWSLDHIGTLARSAADTALLFATLVDSPATVPAMPLEGLRLGIPHNFFFERCDLEILDGVERLQSFLQSAGAAVQTVQMPSLEHSRTVSLTVQMPEALSYHNRYLEERGHLYGQDFRAGLALGQNLLAEPYVRARRFIEVYRREMAEIFDQVDVLLTPATPVIAPEIGAVNVTTDGVSEPAGNAITRYTSFFNMTGHPAITLPCGMHSAGLPIGAQLIGRHYADEAVIDLATQIEAGFDFELPLPDVG